MQSFLRAAPLPLALALAGLLPAPAGAQSRSDREIRSEIEFARGLATEWQFVELAESIIEGLEAEGVSDKMKSELGLAKCDIYAEGALRENDEQRRDELFSKAIDAYLAFIEDNPYSDQREAAERAYVDTSNKYARFLALALEDATGDEATALRARIDELLVDAVKRTQSLIDSLEADLANNPTELKQRELWTLKLNRGQMLLQRGLVAEDGTYHFGEASETLENLALEAGERTPFGLRAYLELGRVFDGMGDPAGAVPFFEFVVDFVIPIDQEEWNAVVEVASPVEMEQRWQFAELSIAEFLAALRDAGQLGPASRWGLHFYHVYRSQGFNLRPQGYLGLLEVARVLLDSGGFVGGNLNSGELVWFETREEAEGAGFRGRNGLRASMDLALFLAQTVNRENRGNILQVRAQKLIAEVIDRGLDVDPEVLFEAAQGEYFSRDYAAATEAFKRVLAALETRDEATRAVYGAKVHYHLGRSYGSLDRHLEAAVAFREGVERWSGDPEYDGLNAKGYLAEVKELRRGLTEKDPLLEKMLRQGEDLVATHASESAGDVIFNKALREWSQKNWEAAREQFLEVPGSANNHEKAIVYAAVCLFRMGRERECADELQGYLEGFVEDPKNAVSGETEKLRRREAMAMATFYWGRAAFNQQQWDVAIQRLDRYEVKYEAQTDYAPNALFLSLGAHLKMGDVEGAQKVHDRMVAKYPDHGTTGTAALQIAGALRDAYDAAVEAGDAELARSIMRKRAEYVARGNELATRPSFNNLRSEADLWLELGEWPRAAEVLTDLRRKFADSKDAEEAELVQSWVLPKLGLALVREHKVQDAAELLSPLVPEDPDDTESELKPSAETTEALCRALGGWVEGDAASIQEVPGIGGEANFAKATAWWNKLTRVEGQLNEKWTCPWYELKFNTAYAYYQWGQIDSKKLDAARSQIAGLKQLLDDPRLEAVKEACGGDDTLRQRFLWLDDKLTR